jgi:hypothetical protein
VPRVVADNEAIGEIQLPYSKTGWVGCTHSAFEALASFPKLLTSLHSAHAKQG